MYKETARGYAENQWNLGAYKIVTMEQLWAWSKADGLDSKGDTVSRAD